MKLNIDWKSGPKCRLLTLLLIVLVSVVSAAKTVDGAALRGNPLQDAQADLYSLFFNKNIRDNFESAKTGETTQIRKHFLYNMCSERFVKMIRKGRKGISAKGKGNSKNMDFLKLIFESLPNGAMRIFGEHTDLHLCFNHRGKLIARKNGTKRGCQFKEEYTETRDYTMYRSTENTNWYLGFKKNGKPLKGIAINDKSKEDCFKFQKLSKLPTRNRTNTSRKKCKRKNGPAGVDFCHETFQEIINSGRKVRHSKSHRRRRKG